MMHAFRGLASISHNVRPPSRFRCLRYHSSTSGSSGEEIRIPNQPYAALYTEDAAKVATGALHVLGKLFEQEKDSLSLHASRFVEMNAKSISMSREHGVELHMPEELRNLSGAVNILEKFIPSNIAKMVHNESSTVKNTAKVPDAPVDNVHDVKNVITTEETITSTVTTTTTTDILDTVVPPATTTTPTTSFTEQLKAKSKRAIHTDHTSLGSRPNKFEGVERTVPASPFARFMGFSGMAAQMALGTMKDMTVNLVSGNSDKSAMLSESNLERLVTGLCRMRGAALKIGQMLSIQDESLMSPEFARIMARVRQSADIMPKEQLEATMVSELGPDWESKFRTFERMPIAAASIGQVHRAITHEGRLVAVKVQYPGVADSINSDLVNLTRLLKLVNLTPKGLYLDHAMISAREELAMECDYLWEATAQSTFGTMIKNDPVQGKFVNVPEVITDLSTARVLTSEFVHGVPVDKIVMDRGQENSSLQADLAFADSSENRRKLEEMKSSDMQASKVFEQVHLTQEMRDEIGTALMRLTFQELFQWRIMQTDPNWSNFLYDPEAHTVHLIDFGATRVYNKKFVDAYLRMVNACGRKDRDGIIAASKEMGFLTGDETPEMIDTHIAAATIVGEPFNSNTPYDFVAGDISSRVAPLAAKMLQSRLAAPPMEAYTLHRKLAGAFLTLKRLGAVVDCKTIMDNINAMYQFGPQDDPLKMPNKRVEKA